MDEKPKKKFSINVWWFWTLVVIGLVIIGAMSNGNSGAPQQNSPSSAESNTSQMKPKAPLTSFGDGTFIVGTDIKAGTYRTAGGKNCYYERLSGFGGTDSDIIANADPTGSAIVTINVTDKGFRSADCGTWTQINVSKGSQSNQATVSSVQPAENQSSQSSQESTPATVLAQPSAPMATPVSTPASTDYTRFQHIYFYDYTRDPSAYLNTNIELKGTINNQFLAAGDKGGDSNYIGIIDPNWQAHETIMLKVPNNSNYQKAVLNLQYEDLVAAYGVGSQSQYFTMTNGTQILVPVITISRIDVIGACGASGCGEDGTVKTIFP